MSEANTLRLSCVTIRCNCKQILHVSLVCTLSPCLDHSLLLVVKSCLVLSDEAETRGTSVRNITLADMMHRASDPVEMGRDSTHSPRWQNYTMRGAVKMHSSLKKGVISTEKHYFVEVRSMPP